MENVTSHNEFFSEVKYEYIVKWHVMSISTKNYTIVPINNTAVAISGCRPFALNLAIWSFRHNLRYSGLVQNWGSICHSVASFLLKRIIIDFKWWVCIFYYERVHHWNRSRGLKFNSRSIFSFICLQKHFISSASLTTDTCTRSRFIYC